MDPKSDIQNHANPEPSHPPPWRFAVDDLLQHGVGVFETGKKNHRGDDEGLVAGFAKGWRDLVRWMAATGSFFVADGKDQRAVHRQ